MASQSASKCLIDYFNSFPTDTREYQTFTKILQELKDVIEKCEEGNIMNATRWEATFSFKVVNAQDEIFFLTDDGSIKANRLMDETVGPLLTKKNLTKSLNNLNPFKAPKRRPPLEKSQYTQTTKRKKVTRTGDYVQASETLLTAPSTYPDRPWARDAACGSSNGKSDDDSDTVLIDDSDSPESDIYSERDASSDSDRDSYADSDSDSDESRADYETPFVDFSARMVKELERHVDNTDKQPYRPMIIPLTEEYRVCEGDIRLSGADLCWIQSVGSDSYRRIYPVVFELIAVWRPRSGFYFRDVNIIMPEKLDDMRIRMFDTPKLYNLPDKYKIKLDTRTGLVHRRWLAYICVLTSR